MPSACSGGLRKAVGVCAGASVCEQGVIQTLGQDGARGRGERGRLQGGHAVGPVEPVTDNITGVAGLICHEGFVMKECGDQERRLCELGG